MALAVRGWTGQALGPLLVGLPFTLAAVKGWRDRVRPGTGTAPYAQSGAWHKPLRPDIMAAWQDCLEEPEKMQGLVLQGKHFDARILRSAGKALNGKDLAAYPPGSQQRYPQISWISRKSPGESVTWRGARASGCLVWDWCIPQAA